MRGSSTSITCGTSEPTSAISSERASPGLRSKKRLPSARSDAQIAIGAEPRWQPGITALWHQKLECSERPRSSADRALAYGARSRAFESPRGRSSHSFYKVDDPLQPSHFPIDLPRQDEHAHPGALRARIDRMIADHERLVRRDPK